MMRWGLIDARGRALQKLRSSAARYGQGSYICGTHVGSLLDRILTVHPTHLLCITPESSTFFRFDLHVAVEEHIIGLDTLLFQDFGDLLWPFEKVKSDVLGLCWQAFQNSWRTPRQTVDLCPALWSLR